MIPSEKMSPLDADAELVAQTRRGDGDAFGRIVARYQGLICALAYNATGSLAQSEDLAQEAFVIAWKQLPALREPEKLRSWLCGIVRNLGRRARRGEKFDPVLRAEPLENAGHGCRKDRRFPLRRNRADRPDPGDTASRDCCRSADAALSQSSHRRTGRGGSEADREPPRESWRLHSLRGWSDEQTRQVPSGDAGASGANGPRTPQGVPIGVGGYQVDR